MATIRAKFRCNSVNNFGTQEKAELSAVTDTGSEENLRYHTATPAGNLSITIDNPNVRGFFVPGLYYYLDFEHAPEVKL